VLTLMSFSEFTAFFALIPVALYNGRRGLKMKYFFYAFYPVHLLLIWLVALLMGMGWTSAIG
ncbi:MAG: TraX family protein, partial [Acetatifactor sp.]